MKVLLVIAFAALGNVFADSSTLIREDKVSYKILVNGDLKCRAGTDFPHYATQTELSIVHLNDLLGFKGPKNNINSVTLEAGLGDRCSQFEEILNVPHPTFITVLGTRRLSRKFQSEFGTKCGEYLLEELELRIPNTELVLKGEKHFAVGFVENEKCKD